MLAVWIHAEIKTNGLSQVGTMVYEAGSRFHGTCSSGRGQPSISTTFPAIVSLCSELLSTDGRIE